MRRQAGTVENLESYSVTLHCYDCRSVRLTFVTEPDGIKKVSRNKDENQTVPKKIIKVEETRERIRLNPPPPPPPLSLLASARVRKTG